MLRFKTKNTYDGPVVGPKGTDLTGPACTTPKDKEPTKGTSDYVTSVQMMAKRFVMILLPGICFVVTNGLLIDLSAVLIVVLSRDVKLMERLYAVRAAGVLSLYSCVYTYEIFLSRHLVSSRVWELSRYSSVD